MSATVQLTGATRLYAIVGDPVRMAQVFAKGYRADIMRRILCFALFWHTLDIIWVGIFTVVYLMGLAL